jgi:O-antigen ligase
VACQCSLGLKAFGEVTLDVSRSGVSVVQGEGLRWLRPYGLLPHPNVLAGVFVVGVFAAVGLFLTSETYQAHASRLVKSLVAIRQAALLACCTAIVWMLLLSFSRGAWAGTGIGALAVLAGLIGRRAIRGRLAALVALMLVLGAAFFVLYRPLIVARTGAGQENTEMRSLADRIVYAEIAQAAITKAPIIGLGGGNTPWYAAYYLEVYTDYDLQGDHVHNIYLETWGDLGLIGLVLFGLLQGIGLWAAVQAYRRTGDIVRLMMIGAWIALAIIGLFDHYPWSLVMGQTVWVALLAVPMSEDAGTTSFQNS